MRYFRFLLLSALAALALIALAACGDDGESLTLEEYMARLTTIDDEYDPRFEEVFGGEGASARALADAFDETASDFKSDLEAVDPPEEVADHHNDLTGAIGDAVKAVDAASEDFDENSPPEDFGGIFEDEAVNTSFEEVDQQFCDIQAIADEKEIEADVGCEEEDAGPDPSTLEPVETNAVLIEDFGFEPPHIQVAAGDAVTWTQGADGAPHTATSDDDTFDSGTLGDEGEVFEFTFDETGEYPYSCEIHPEMRGLVTVTE